jgi:Secretion system C-terminal sorting domain
MKKIYAITFGFLVSVQLLTAQTTYTFTNCSATGPNGPTQGQVTAAYASTTLAGLVTINTQGVQEWTVPGTANYRIETRGAQGGCGGGMGAKIVGDFTLTQGQVILVVVGQTGLSAPASVGNGGGGGSYAVLSPNTALCIAGGGGGTGHNCSNGSYTNISGTTGTSGLIGQYGNAGAGGTSGSGGGYSTTTGNGIGNGGGGGGFNGNGGSLGNAFGGYSFLNGSAGGSSTGGFGGGGGSNLFIYGCGSSPHGGSGGGGYSGGGGGGNNCNGAAGGGGSYNNGTNQSNTAAYNSGMGQVIITSLCVIPVITVSASLATVCVGSPTTLTASGGTTYAWMPGNLTGASVVVSPTATTTYTVTGSSSGCSATATITITVNTGSLLSASASLLNICSASNTILTATGATSYTWMPGNLIGASVTVNPLVTTTYTVTGTNSFGCTSTTTITITINASPTVTATIAAPILFTEPFTSSLGQMTTNASSNGAWAFNNTCAGAIQSGHTTPGTAMFIGSTCVYGNGFLTVSGNMDSPTIAIGSAGATLTFKYRINTECGASTCPYDVVTVQGSVNNFVTSSTLVTSTNASLVPNGTVWGTATVSLASFANTSMKLRFNFNSIDGSTNNIDGVYIDDITVLGVPSTLCAGDNVTINASGASTYAWMPGNLTGASVVVSPASTTTYTLTGTNTLGCTGTSTITVTVNPSPVIVTSVTLATVCVGGSTTITASGAASYTWMPGNLTGSSVTVSPTATTTYTVTGINSQGCSGNSTVTITVNAPPVVTANSSSPAVCIGSSVTLTGSGASSYTWSNNVINAVSFVPAATATYTVTGTNPNGCTNTATITVTVNPLPIITSSATASTICVGASSTITASGAATYAWVPGNFTGNSITVTPSATTTYTITGTNGNGCVNTTTITISVNALPIVSASSSPSSVCAGNSVTLTGGGANTYAWSGGVTNAVSFIPTSTLTYTVTGTASNGCTNTATITVTVHPLPQVVVVSASLSVCLGSSINLAAGGASTYSWMPGNLSGVLVAVSPTSNTTYTITGTDVNGCVNTATISISVLPLPQVVALSASPTICSGSSSVITASGATTYSWMPGSLVGTTITVSPLTTTTYTVTGSDASGCANTATTTVTVNPLPVVNITTSSNAICLGSSATLAASGATSYTWMPGNLVGASIIVSPISTTTYTVTGTNGNGCVNTSSVTVVVNPLPTVSVSASTNTICAGSSSILSASGAATYTWMPGNLTGSLITVLPASSTTYTVTGTDANGCNNTATSLITVNAIPIVALGPDVIQCGGTLILNAGNPGCTYLWSNSSTTQSITVSTSGTYSVVVTNANGCTGSDVIQVTMNSAFVVSLGPDVIQCGGTLILNAGNPGSTYLWSNASTTQSITVSSSGTYSVVVTNTNGCIGSDVVIVTINPLPNLTASASSMVVCVDDANVTLTGTPTGGTWSGPGVTGSNLNPAIAGVGAQTASYSYTDANGCSNIATVIVQVNACVGFVEHTLANGVSVYPNPNNGSFTLSVNANVGDLTIKITDMQGRVVYASVENNVNAGFVKQISLDTQSSGMYLMHIIANGEQRTEKIAVQK